MSELLESLKLISSKLNLQFVIPQGIGATMLKAGKPALFITAFCNTSLLFFAGNLGFQHKSSTSILSSLLSTPEMSIFPGSSGFVVEWSCLI